MKDYKAVLHAHHHFYRPVDRSVSLLRRGGHNLIHPDEFAYRCVRPIPGLKKIVDNVLDKGIELCALSVCHTPTSGMDPGFEIYIRQLGSLEEEYEFEYDEKKGILRVERKNPLVDKLNHATIIRSQEIRAKYNGLPVDINLIGGNRLVVHSQDLDETARIGKEEGMVVIPCHPMAGTASMGLEKAKDLVDMGLADTFEGWNAGVAERYNLKGQGIAVPDSHHYKEIDTAYICLDYNFRVDLSLGKLGDNLRNGNFENHYGSISKTGEFMSHRLPILMSIPGHLIRKPNEIMNFLKSGMKRFKR